MQSNLDLSNLSSKDIESQTNELIKDSFSKVESGENILFEFDNQVSLMKYEGITIGSQDPLRIRANRHTHVYCLGNLFERDETHPFTHKDPSKRISKRLRLELLGTHRIDFAKDEEFNIHLPSAKEHTDLYLNLADKFADGRTQNIYDNISIVRGESLVRQRLQEITREEYFKTNIEPFLESKPTQLQMPQWRTNDNFLTGLTRRLFKNSSSKPHFDSFNIFKGMEWLESVAQELNHGDFAYVGSKEEVYLLAIAKDKGSLAYQGTYTTSVKPIFWFSNNYLGHMSKFDMQRPLFQGDGLCNVAEYRTQGVPEFEGKPFIFSAMGRTQDCKNTIYTGEPEIITGNLDEALAHFKTTDFKEFEDIVEKYATNVNQLTSNTPNRGDSGFFY